MIFASLNRDARLLGALLIVVSACTSGSNANDSAPVGDDTATEPGPAAGGSGEASGSSDAPMESGGSTAPSMGSEPSTSRGEVDVPGADSDAEPDGQTTTAEQEGVEPEGMEPEGTEPESQDPGPDEPEGEAPDTAADPAEPDQPTPTRDGGAPPDQVTEEAPGAGPELTPMNTCSETELRTGPPPGKEAFRAKPANSTFPFSVHWIGTVDDPRYISMTSLTDLDNDGDLDYASGQRSNNGGGDGMFWWEYCSPDHWVYHYVGTGHNSVAGGNAVDADQDGWVDLVAGDSWYRNPQNPRESEWERFTIGAPEAEEVVVGEVTGEAPPEVLYVWQPIVPQYWTPRENPRALWASTELTFNSEGWQQQGGAIGDLDGDGDNDILVGYRFWYDNVNGDGSEWTEVEVFGNQFDNPYDSPLAHLGDLDGDGDVDFAVASHFGGSVAWAENVDSSGRDFSFHELETNMNFLHAIVIADFDNDGDLDIFAGQNVGPSYIFENTDGQGAFTQQRIAEDVRMHEARVGDVDCDGDLDIAGKPWGDPNEGGEANLTESREHVYLQNQIVDLGGPPRFERSPYEEMHRIVQDRVCP